MNSARGTLLPITALYDQNPNLLDAGYDLVDWLSATGQDVWQMLPIHQGHWHGNIRFNSPYSSYGIGLNPALIPESHHLAQHLPEVDNEFLAVHGVWVNEYALFVALSEYFETDDWLRWPLEYRVREENTLSRVKTELADRIQHIINQQAYLHKQFSKLRCYAHEHSVQLWGDVPFYLPLQSPMVWQHQDLFVIPKTGKLTYTSGAQKGPWFGRQVWGHPLYDWERHRKELSELWRKRLVYQSALFDTVRIDSVVNFYTYGKMHASDPDLDTRCVGPGSAMFRDIIQTAHSVQLEIYVEDVSQFDLTEARQVMAAEQVPGVSVFSMSFSSHAARINLDRIKPYSFNHDCVYLTSSHDTVSMLGYLDSVTSTQRKAIAAMFPSLDGSETNKVAVSKIRNSFYERARISLINMQDWLITDVRTNIPGTIDPLNWRYQLPGNISDLSTNLEKIGLE